MQIKTAPPPALHPFELETDSYPRGSGMGAAAIADSQAGTVSWPLLLDCPKSPRWLELGSCLIQTSHTVNIGYILWKMREINIKVNTAVIFKGKKIEENGIFF